MKKIRSILSIMLCLIILLSSTPVSAIATTTSNSFSGYTPISTKEDLNSIRNDLSGKYYLTNNIVFSEADFSEGGLFYNNGEGWNPIGTFDKPFIGVFDGNGYAIINLCINTTCNADAYIGLFGYTKCSKIMNLGCYSGELSVDTTETKYIDVYVGAIVGYNDSGILENCYNYSNISLTYKSDSSGHVGGIAGGNELWSYCEDAIINKCYNKGNITVNSSGDYPSFYIGGIVGTNDECSITTCHNKGKLDFKGNGRVELGGIAGESEGQYYADNISNCYNSGCVEVSSSSGSVLCVGGLLGSKSYSDGDITQCFNAGAIIASGGFVEVGGIIGDNFNGDIVECYNSGTLSVATTFYNAYGGPRIYSGGITGVHDIGNIKNCFNSGNTIATCNVGDAYLSGGYKSRFGGIVGSNSEVVSNSYNVGTFSVVSDCKTYCGGIIGYNNDIVSNCYFLENPNGGVGYNTKNGTSETKQCSTVEMEAQETYLDFDFDNIWEVDKYEMYSYPTLKNVAYSEYGSGSIPNYPQINYVIKFGLDRFSFGEDITGFVGDEIDTLVVYTSANENITSLDIKSSNTDIVEIGTIEIGVGDYLTTSENEHIATIPLKLKAEGRSTITITSPEGVSESVIVTVSKKPEAKKSIAIFTTEKSLSVNTGDSMWLAFGLMDESSGLIDDDWKKMAVVVSDPTILSLSEYEKTEYGYALNIIGKKEGSTNVTISDTATGISTSIVISVYDKYIKSYSYSMHEVNEFYPNNKLEYNIKTNIYNLNGLYVNNYCCAPIYNSTGTSAGNIGETPKEFQVTFDVYNSRYYNGAVDIYDADGVWIGSEYIDRYSDITSIRDTGEQLFFLISDVITGEIFTYEQASFSKKTSINIKVPNGGYFTISNNMSESPGTFFVNAFEILYDTTSDLIEFATSKSTDKTAFDKFYKEATKSFAQNVIDARNESLSGEAKKMAMEVALNSLKSEIEKIQKKFIKSEAKDFVVNGTELYSDISTLAENVLNSYSVNWKHLYQSATGVGESMFIKFSGPAGVALKSMFAITKASNKLLMAAQMSRSLDNTYATFYSSIDEGYINSHGIVVNTNGNVDSEAVLQVFRVSNSDAVDVILGSNNPLERYELYNISFVKNDQLVQPNGKVSVHIPIPEGMVSNTCKIYRQEEDGSWNILDAHIEDNYLVFETEHFSLYSVIGNMDNLSIYSMPNKVVYSDGDTLETDGLVLDLNGKKISEGFICDPTVISGSGNLRITVRYENLSTDFNVFVKQQGNYSISGQIESFGEPSFAISLSLLENGIVIDKTTSTDGTYKFDSVSSGTYTVEVSKLNHVTRTYDVTVVDEDVVQNVKIHLLGDVNGDGNITIADATQIQKHLANILQLDEAHLEAADTNGDGRVSVADATQIQKYLANIISELG